MQAWQDVVAGSQSCSRSSTRKIASSTKCFSSRRDHALLHNMESETPQAWIWMALPLMGLAFNLIFPRTRSFQCVCLSMLILAAWLDGDSLVGLNPIHRAVAATERTLQIRPTMPGELEGPVIDNRALVSNLKWGLAVADQTMFDVCLGLTLGIIFAVIPPTILMRLWSRMQSQGAVLQSRHNQDNAVVD